MKVVHFSDLHLDDYQTGSKTPGDRLEDCLEVIDDVYRHAVAIGARLITFGGDWNNIPKFISTKVENAAMLRVYQLMEECPYIEWRCISGNHDFATKNLIDKPAQTSLTPLGLAFMPKFQIIDNRGSLFGQYGVYGIPYYEYPEHYSQALDEAVKWVKGMGKMLKKTTLLIHQTPNGIGNTNIKADTDVHDPRYDYFDLVLCGHIHIKQRITDKFVLVGNPLQKDYSDEGLEKGFWEYDLSNPMPTLQFISRRGRYPEFRRVKAGTKIKEGSRDIITEVPDEVSIVLDERATLDEFGTAVSREQLVQNYWTAAGNNDEKLLQTGLSFL